jgi:hypothetical protein
MSKNVNEILDFSDLDDVLEFKFKENIYYIPAFTKKQLDKLMSISRKFVAFTDAEPKLPEEESEISKDDLDKTNDFFDMQDEYLLAAVMKKGVDGNIDESLSDSDLASWPVKLRAKVMQLINEQMSITIGDVAGTESEKKS